MFAIEVVDHDQVEIGGRRHLAAAELAERKDRDLLPRDAAMASREIVLDGARAARGSAHPQAARRPRRPARPTRCRTGCACRSGTCAPARRCGCDRENPRSSPPVPSERSSTAASVASSGSAPKKVGSITASMTSGNCARLSASRGAVPSTSAISAIRSGFCRSSENSRPPPCSAARKRSKATAPLRIGRDARIVAGGAARARRVAARERRLSANVACRRASREPGRTLRAAGESPWWRACRACRDRPHRAGSAAHAASASAAGALSNSVA